MTQLDSPDHSQNASGGGAIANANVTGEKVKGWSTNVLLALSIMVNVWALYELRDYVTAKWLNGWDLNQHINGAFHDLKVKVETDDALIKAFGPQCGKGDSNGRRDHN
jgi:hypothetical protein